MKKLLCILIFLMLVLAAAGADEADENQPPPEKIFSVSISAVRDALFIRHFTGDFANKIRSVADSPFPWQGDGEIKSFKTSAFDDTLEAKLKLAYSSDDFGGLFALEVVNDDNTVLNSDWEVWMRLGKYVRVLTGNQAQRGKTAQYQNFDDLLPFKIDNLGVMFPVWQYTPQNTGSGGVNNLDTSQFPYGYGGQGENKGYAEFAGTETGDLFVPAGSTGRLSGFLVDFVYAPVTITASVGGLYESLLRPFLSPWVEKYKTTTSIWDNVNDSLSNTSVSFAFRAEGAEIAEVLTVSAVYKYADTAIAKLETSQKSEAIDEQVKSHTFGLFANAKFLNDDLGITLGYSGLIGTWENSLYKDFTVIPGMEDTHGLSKYAEAVLPFYSGVDLRACYTGAKNLSITFNTNVSFANAKGTDDRLKKFVKAWAYEMELNEASSYTQDRSESYFGLYNALGIKYVISKALTADFQAANQLGFFTLTWEYDPLISITDSLGIYTGVSYVINKKAGFRSTICGGLDLRVNMYTYRESGSNDLAKCEAGYLDFGIPIRLKVEF